MVSSNIVFSDDGGQEHKSDNSNVNTSSSNGLNQSYNSANTNSSVSYFNTNNNGTNTNISSQLLPLQLGVILRNLILFKVDK